MNQHRTVTRKEKEEAFLVANKLHLIPRTARERGTYFVELERALSERRAAKGRKLTKQEIEIAVRLARVRVLEHKGRRTGWGKKEIDRLTKVLTSKTDSKTLDEQASETIEDLLKSENDFSDKWKQNKTAPTARVKDRVASANCK